MFRNSKRYLSSTKLIVDGGYSIISTHTDAFFQFSSNDTEWTLLCQVYKLLPLSSIAKNSETFLASLGLQKNKRTRPLDVSTIRTLVALFELGSQYLKYSNNTLPMKRRYDISDSDSFPLEINLDVGMITDSCELAKINDSSAYIERIDKKSLSIDNRIYLILDRARFSLRGPNSSFQVMCQLRKTDGTFLTDPIIVSPEKKCCSKFYSSVKIDNFAPVWQEMIRVNLNPSQIRTCHFFFTFRNLEVKDKDLSIIGFSFLPLVQNENVLMADGYYDLTVYKYVESLVLPNIYLGFPAGPNSFVPLHISSSVVISMAAVAEASTKLLPLPHQFKIGIYLHYSQLFQDLYVENVVNWKKVCTKNHITMLDVVLGIKKANQHEIGKKSKQIFQAYMDMFFEMGPHVEARLFDLTLSIQDEVFESFLYFLTIMSNREFESQFKYLEIEISNPLSYRSSLPKFSHSLFSYLITKFGDLQAISKLCKLWNILLRIIIKCTYFDSELSLKSTKLFFSQLKQVFLIDPNKNGTSCQYEMVTSLQSLFKEIEVIEEKYFMISVLPLLAAIDNRIESLYNAKISLLNTMMKNQTTQSNFSSLWRFSLQTIFEVQNRQTFYEGNLVLIQNIFSKIENLHTSIFEILSIDTWRKTLEFLLFAHRQITSQPLFIPQQGSYFLFINLW